MLFLFGHNEKVPQALIAGRFHRAPGHLFAGTIEANDTSFSIEHDNQSSDRVQNRRDDIAFILQCLFRPLEIGDVERNSLNKPWVAVRSQDHFCFAVEPHYTTITRNYSVC